LSGDIGSPFFARSYQSVKSILKNALDQQPLGMPTLPPAPPSPHDNIRGAEYFE
jgi:hypothetical protein